MINDLKVIRQQLNMSIGELSLRTGITKSTICKLELGQTTKPSPETICRLAYGLKINPEDLFLILVKGERYYKGNYS